ncbi:enhanced intracellular survival protein Eis [Cytobacillus sp. FJAT-53684]|uniref:Enhanced intracellular survival protein Eis n=1 Tax=Cytobacillus mangrovibacter TaxID=3299024 RepID=A0ABW6K6P4_9BACI
MTNEIEVKLVPITDDEQVHRLRDYSFPNKYNEERRKDFHYWIRQSTTIGAYDRQQLIGQLLVLPLNMTVHGVNYEMGGIGFVATYPEYRNQGIVKKLIIRSLEEMRRKNQYLSILAPFSVSFYRHFGWELFFDKLHYSIPKESFPQFSKSTNRIIRFSFEWIKEKEFQEIQQFHNQQALKTNGGMLRDVAWWRRLARREPDCHFALYKGEDSVAGYIRYEIKDLTFSIKDFVADGIDAEQALWNFISSHKASVHAIEGTASAASHFGFHFDQPQFKKEIIQDVMVRIVDVYAFLKRYPWRNLESSLYVTIQDPYAPWNELFFHIKKDGDVEIVQDRFIERKRILFLPISLFSSMMVGYLSVKDTLLYAEYSLEKETVENWQHALPIGQPVFYEYF